MDQIFSDPGQHDLILIGGQEAQYMKKQAVIMDFANYLAKFGFLTIGSVGLWEIFLVGFIKTHHAKHLKN
jgi:hypothetical protein